MLAQHGHEIRMGLALVQEYRMLVTGREIQLPCKGTALLGGWRVIPVVVEATFAGRDRHGI